MFRTLHTRIAVCLAPKVVAQIDYYKSVTFIRFTLSMKIAVCVGSRQQGSSLGFIKELLSLRVL